MSKIASVPKEFYFGSEQSESQVRIKSSTQFTHVKIARNKYCSYVSVPKQNGGFLSTERNCGDCQTPWCFETNTVWGKATHFGSWPPMATYLWVSEEGVQLQIRQTGTKQEDTIDLIDYQVCSTDGGCHNN